MHRLTLMVGVTLAMASAGFTGEIVELPVPEGAQTIQPTGVSANGLVVVGTFATPSGQDAFVWKENEGIRSLGRLDGASDGYSAAVSADGRVIVGSSGTMGFRWTEAEGMVDLGIPDGMESVESNGVSADGGVIVGSMRTADHHTHAMMWSAADGITDLGTLPEDDNSYALGVSPDGTVIVGYGDLSNTGKIPSMLMWKRSANPAATEGGATYRLEKVGNGAKLRSVSADGSMAAGDERAFAKLAGLWKSGEGNGWRRLGGLGTDGESYGYAISDDGALVVGASFSGPGQGRAFLWDDHTEEMRELLSVLGKEGIDGAGRWTNLVNPLDISGDAISGYNIVGQGIVDGRLRVFLVRGLKLSKEGR
ncbi:MAG: hypothetical protein WCJ31_18430 [Planctomycetia bacterium]